MKKLLCLVGGAISRKIKAQNKIIHIIKHSTILYFIVKTFVEDKKAASPCWRIRLFNAFFLSMTLFHGTAQTPSGLHVGDLLPDISGMQTLGHPLKVTKLSAIKKPIILDFFATSCSSCIGLLPHLDELQKAYEDSLKILVVTNESESHIRKFLKTNPIVRDIDLTFIVEDTALNALFQYRTIPHEIWIGEDLVVKAITGHNYVTKPNIDALVANQLIDLPIKDDYVKFDIHQGLDKYVLSNRIFSKSYFAGFIDNAPKHYSGSFSQNDSLFKEMFYVNFQALSLILAAFENKFPSNRVILNVKDSSKLLMPKNADVGWKIRNTYSYSLTLPTGAPESIRVNKVLTDLGLHLGMKIRIEKKDMDCYELVTIGTPTVSPDSRGGAMVTNFYPANGQYVSVRNCPLSLLVRVLNNGLPGADNPIVINGTKNKKVDLTLPIENIADIKAVDKSLRLYGLHLRKTNRLLDMVVISDN